MVKSRMHCSSERMSHQDRKLDVSWMGERGGDRICRDRSARHVNSRTGQRDDWSIPKITIISAKLSGLYGNAGIEGSLLTTFKGPDRSHLPAFTTVKT